MSDNFFQIYLSNIDEELPPALVRQSARFKQLYSNCSYLLLDKSSLRDCLVDIMPAEVLLAYDSLVPLAYKSDLARYCLLYHFGGWYADITIKPEIGMRLGSSIEFAYFYDFGSGLPSIMRSAHDVMNAFFYSRSNHPILSHVIESVLRNCRNHDYGVTALCPTGPTLFGRIIAQFVPAPSLLFGHFMPLTPFHQNQNKAFVGQDGSIVAWHKSAWHRNHPGGGDLTCFGLKGTNNYQELWAKRSVFSI